MDTYFDYSKLHHNEARTKTMELWEEAYLKASDSSPIRPLHIISSTDFYTDSLSLALDSEKDMIIDMEEAHQYHLGRMFCPLGERKDFYIMIRDELFGHWWRPLLTFTHEYTHVIDYDNFIKCIGDTYKQRVSDHYSYKIFTQWSEFHATYKQRLITMSILADFNEKKYTSEYFLEFALNYDMFNSNENLKFDLKERTLSIKDITDYMGKYLVYDQLYPNEFQNFKQVPKEILDVFDSSFGQLYQQLSSCNNFFKALLKFSELSLAVDTFWDSFKL